MSSLSATQSAKKFLGIDFGSIGSDFRVAWSGMLQWRALAWLRPQLPVRLWLSDGTQGFCANISESCTTDGTSARGATFDAILLPENLVLRRVLEMPRLQDQDLQSAILLELQLLNPFDADDMVWAHCIHPSIGSGLAQVHIVLSSRKLIAKYIAASFPNFDTATPEVWATAEPKRGYLMLPGFGEGLRQRRGVTVQIMCAALFLLFFIGLALIAVSPSIQLYLRAVQANQAMSQLQQKVGPVLSQRDSLLRSTEQLEGLGKLIGQPVQTLQVLDLVTRSLPDDTSLLSFKISGLKVTLTGQTSNASALMKQLGATQGLKDVRAPTPAVKPLGASRESFSIEFMLVPDQLGPAP